MPASKKGSVVSQAKGILPKGDDRAVLYRNPKTSGYFIAVKLDPVIDRARAQAWFGQVDRLIDQLVARDAADQEQAKGTKVAAVAVGLAPSFFAQGRAASWTPPVEPPAGFPVEGVPSPQRSGPLANMSAWDADVLFYVASVYEARVNAFISQLAALKPDVQRVALERGYQRLDDTEPFGYLDGVRNVVPKSERPEVVFVHRRGKELDEPEWAEGGSYLAYVKIRQFPEVFGQLQPAQQDAAVGRRKDGTRLDQPPGTPPKEEPADVPEGLPPTSHVRKAGPRGVHDEVQIFRRGLPYMETSSEGELRVGLQFCSFQASLEQFDVLFNDWCMNPAFPSAPGSSDPGTDVLLDPNRGLTQIERFGFFFVPPYDQAGLAVAVFGGGPSGRKAKTGRLVVHKRVIDSSNPARRSERRGFGFQVLNDQGQPVGVEFTTDSTGRAVCDEELELDKSYSLRETVVPLPNVARSPDITFLMDKVNKQLIVDNPVTQPGPYGG